MEALLSLAFDNISSKDGLKIRKGIRQIEGLLAQICLPSSTSRSKEKRRPSSHLLGDATTTTTTTTMDPRTLHMVAEDPAFREFFRLQESFEWNVSSQIISCLETLLGMPNGAQSNQLILSALDLLQGVLLLHPPSRALFRREIYMMLLLDLLDAANPPAIQAQALLVLVTALLATPECTRAFEQMDGLLTVASLFKSRTTSKEVKMKVVEFLYFYLMPEAAPDPDRLQLVTRPSRKLVGKEKPVLAPAPTTHVGPMGIRTTQEKQQMLGRYLSNVADLVEDLRENTPFALAV